MRPKRLDIDLANTVTDGLASGNSSAGATLTLDGTLTSGGTFTSADGLARRLQITDLGADDQTGATYTITGTDADGKSQVENIAGPGASATVTTTKYFLTVSSVAIASPVVGSSVNMGTADEAATKTIVLDHYSETQPTVQVDVTGVINYDAEVTLENPMKRLTGDSPENGSPFTFTDQEDLAWVNDANLVNETTNQIAQLGVPGIRAMRMVVNSFTNGAELQVWITQPY